MICKDGQTTTTARIPFASGVQTDSITESTSTNGVTIGKVNAALGADIASPAGGTLNLTTATGQTVDVTGTNNITAITLAQGSWRLVRFTGILTLTHGASLILPGAANITTAAGDYALFVGYASSVVRCAYYVPNVAPVTNAVTAASAFGTDNILIKSDGTGRGSQSTGISVADTTNDMSGVGTISAGATITATSTDAGAAIGPTLDLYRNSASPAASDIIGGARFQGEDSAGNTETYAQVYGEIVDPTSTSEDARLHLGTVIAGTLASRGYVQNGLVMTGATGGDQGAGTINATAVYKNGAEITGKIAQVVVTQSAALASTATNIPYDDTIPQITEGAEIYTRSITPTNASSTLYIEVVLHVSANADNIQLITALFQDATANALAAASVFGGANGSTQAQVYTLTLSYSMTAGTTSSTTFRVRCGHSAGAGSATIYINSSGAGAGRVFGGVNFSSITITEVLP